MGRVEATAFVDAAFEIVWNTLNDIDNTPEWVVGLQAAEVKTAGVYGLGTIYDDYNRLGPVLQKTAWRITRFEPTTCQIHESESTIFPAKLIMNLSPLNDNTRVQMIIDYRVLPKLGPISRLLEYMLTNCLLKMMLKQNLRRLNQYLRQRPNTIVPQ